MADLFEAAGLTPHAPSPLADRLRPQRLGEVVGQNHLLGPEGPIGRMAEAKRLSSMILWGPPGTGKTTIARLLAKEAGYEFQQISAVFSGVADLKKAFEQARMRRAAGQSTLLFVDEIHRFNRAQQDGFLPFVEEGIVTLVGATTENPSFELNGALLSRSQVYVLKRLDDEALESLLAKAEAHEQRPLSLEPEARQALVAMADGDGRYLLTLTETLFNIGAAKLLSIKDLGQGQFALRAAEEVVGVLGGVGQDQRHGVGFADVLDRHADQPPGDEQRVLPAAQHPRQPVERRVRIGAAH